MDVVIIEVYHILAKMSIFVRYGTHYHIKLA